MTGCAPTWRDRSRKGEDDRCRRKLQLAEIKRFLMTKVYIIIIMRRQFIILEAHRETSLSLPFLGPFQRAPPTELKQTSQAERYQQKCPSRQWIISFLNQHDIPTISRIIRTLFHILQYKQNCKSGLSILQYGSPRTIFLRGHLGLAFDSLLNRAFFTLTCLPALSSILSTSHVFRWPEYEPHMFFRVSNFLDPAW